MAIQKWYIHNLLIQYRDPLKIANGLVLQTNLSYLVQKIHGKIIFTKYINLDYTTRST